MMLGALARSQLQMQESEVQSFIGDSPGVDKTLLLGSAPNPQAQAKKAKPKRHQSPWELPFVKKEYCSRQSLRHCERERGASNVGGNIGNHERKRCGWC